MRAAFGEFGAEVVAGAHKSAQNAVTASGGGREACDNGKNFGGVLRLIEWWRIDQMVRACGDEGEEFIEDHFSLQKERSDALIVRLIALESWARVSE